MNVKVENHCRILQLFEFVFHGSSPRCPLKHISFSWSLNDHPREIMRFQLHTFVENAKFKVQFGFC